MKYENLSISTIWNIDLRVNIKDALTQAKKIGFSSVEAGYNFREERFEELVAATIDLGMNIASLHNFCPLPHQENWGRFFTDLYRLSSMDKRERQQAVDYTLRTIDSASNVGAKAVVIHAGTVEIDNKYTKAIFQLYKEGKRDTYDYELALEQLLAARRYAKDIHMDALVKSLEDITEHAYACNIKIGMENRYYPNEIPNITEAEYLLDIFAKKGLVYWHDTGHAEVQDKLGVESHINYFSKFKDFKDYLYGCHIHDVKGLTDHLTPFSGDLDFSKIKSYLDACTIKVIEAHQPSTAYQLKEGVDRLCK